MLDSLVLLRFLCLGLGFWVLGFGVRLGFVLICLDFVFVAFWVLALCCRSACDYVCRYF